MKLWHFYEGCCPLKVCNFPFTFIIRTASTSRFKDFHKFQFVNSGKQKDQKNNLMLLQAVEQTRKTENETKSTSKMMDATQTKGCFRMKRMVCHCSEPHGALKPERTAARALDVHGTQLTPSLTPWQNPHLSNWTKNKVTTRQVMREGKIILALMI